MQLLALGGVTTVTYLIAFTLPYSLLAWWDKPLSTISTISGHDPAALRLYAAALLVLFTSYLLAARVASGGHGAATWLAAATGAVAANAVLLFLYPVGAADVFDNITRGRIQSLFGGNPFLQVPAEYAPDLFVYYVAWAYSPTAYGPLWELLSRFVSSLTGDGVVANVLAYKLVSVLGYAGTAAFVALLAHRLAPERALTAFVLFAWNPLVLFSTAGNGHNDAVMALFISGSLYLVSLRRWTLATVVMTAGALVKFIPALLLPVVIIFALANTPRWGGRIRYLLGAGAASLALVAVAFVPYWQPGVPVVEILSVERRAGMFTTSLPTLVQMWLEPKLGETAASDLARRSAMLALALWAGWQYGTLWRGRRVEDALQATASILVFYLVVAVLWYQPWYVVWVLPVVAVLPDGVLRRGVLLLCLTSLFKIPLTEFVLFNNDIWQRLDPRNWYLALGVMGLPWLYFSAALVRPLLQRISLTARPHGDRSAAG